MRIPIYRIKNKNHGGNKLESGPVVQKSKVICHAFVSRHRVLDFSLIKFFFFLLKLHRDSLAQSSLQANLFLPLCQRSLDYLYSITQHSEHNWKFPALGKESQILNFIAAKAEQTSAVSVSPSLNIRALAWISFCTFSVGLGLLAECPPPDLSLSAL